MGRSKPDDVRGVDLSMWSGATEARRLGRCSLVRATHTPLRCMWH